LGRRGVAWTMEPRQRLERYFADNRRPDVIAAYLFGSVARGRAHSESDIDVAVLLDRALLPTAHSRAAAAEHLAGDLMTELRSNRVDLVRLNDAPPLFARHIIMDGARLFSADAEAVHSFE